MPSNHTLFEYGSDFRASGSSTASKSLAPSLASRNLEHHQHLTTYSSRRTKLPSHATVKIANLQPKRQGHAIDETRLSTMSTNSCWTCGRKFAMNEGLQDHMNAKHPACDTCYERFTTEKKLQMHQRTLEHCYCKWHDITFVSHDLHIKHNSLDHISHACVDCERGFGCQEALDEHLQGHGHAAMLIALQRRDDGAIMPRDDERRLRCDECNLDFSTLTNLRRHGQEIVHQRSTPLRCPFSDRCTHPFESPSTLLTHLESGTCRSGTNCAALDGLLRMTGPDRHLALAHDLAKAVSVRAQASKMYFDNEDLNIAQFQCRCGAHFKSFHNLISHVKSLAHMAVCSCLLTFDDPAALTTHQHWTGHTSEITALSNTNPHAVSCRCGLRVRDRACLDLHRQATRNKGKEHVDAQSICTVFRRTVGESTEENLAMHMRQHHPSCPICHQTLMSKVELEQHRSDVSSQCYRKKAAGVRVTSEVHRDIAAALSSNDPLAINVASSIDDKSDGDCADFIFTPRTTSTTSAPPTLVGSWASTISSHDGTEDGEWTPNDISVPKRAQDRTSSMSSDDTDRGVPLPGYLDRDNSSSHRRTPASEDTPSFGGKSNIVAVSSSKCNIKRPRLLERLAAHDAPLSPRLTYHGNEAIGQLVTTGASLIRASLVIRTTTRFD